MRMKCLLAALVLLMTVGLCAASLAETGLAHYLLLGVDGWGTHGSGEARSDAIMLASLDYGRDRIIITSFARDSLVEPSYRSGVVKLNALVRSSGGEQVLMDYLEETYEIPINGYFAIDFTGTVYLIDAIGGITVDLTEEETLYLRKHAGNYDGYTLKPGTCRINGAQALYYMRCRSLDNDFGRQGRQGKVLNALLDEVREITPLELVLLLDEILSMYRTDLSPAQQLELGYRALSLRNAELYMHSIPAEGTYRYGKDSQGASGLQFDLETSRRQLYRELGYEIEEEAYESAADEMDTAEAYDDMHAGAGA